MFYLCFLFYFITGCRLGDSNVCSLEDGLKANSHVKSLNMDVLVSLSRSFLLYRFIGNEIGDSGGSSLAEVLKVNSTLTSLLPLR